MRGRVERGFTLIELVVVVAIIGTLVRIVVPYSQNFIRTARAASIVEDFTTIRGAALLYNADKAGAWPPETGVGRTPPGLVSYLPRNFTFTKSRYRLDWENWTTARGTARYPARKVLIGVSLNTTDVKLGRTVTSILGRSSARFTTGNSYTFVIIGL